MNGGQRVDTGVDGDFFNKSLVNIAAPFHGWGSFLPGAEPWRWYAAIRVADKCFSVACGNPLFAYSVTSRRGCGEKQSALGSHFLNVVDMLHAVHHGDDRGVGSDAVPNPLQGRPGGPAF